MSQNDEFENVNPSDLDDLPSEEPKSSSVQPENIQYSVSSTIKDKIDENEMYNTEPKEYPKLPKNHNSGRFLNRQKIILVVFGSFIVLILLFSFVLPALKKDKEMEEEELQKRGSVYIPNEIANWKPDLQKLQESIKLPFDTSEKEDAKENTTREQTDDEILSKIPYADEAKNKAPVQTIGKISDNSISTRPVTNRNEQQVSVQRKTFNSTSVSQNTERLQSNSNAYSNGNISDYMSASQERMNNLVSGIQGSNQNSYQSQNNQSNKQQFSNNGVGQVNMQWNSEYALEYGTIINAALVTGVNTDIPGMIIARVTKAVYNRVGDYVLIPVGTRIFGSYNSEVSYGQKRVQVAWNKMIRPDGLEINLGNFTGVTDQGQAGLTGNVSNHPFEYLKAMGMIAAFSVLDTKYQNLSTAQQNNYAQNVLAETYSEMNKLTGKIVDKALDIQPTITIPQGTEIAVITNVTMDLPPAEYEMVEQKYIRY